MRRYLGTVVLAALALLALWLTNRDEGASPPAVATTASDTPLPTQPPRPLPTSMPSSPSPSSVPSSTSLPSAPPVNPVEPDGVPIDPTSPAVPRNAAQEAQFTAYEQAAAAFMSDFARPAAGVSPDRWWAAVQPHLTEQATAAYEGTDPRNVPFTRVLAPATIVPSEAPIALLAIARIRTDAGWYLVEMTTTENGIRIALAIPEQRSR